MATPASVTLPGGASTPFRYHDYMILYTAGEKVEVVVDGAPPGPMGRLFVVEADKPIKVPYEAGRFILEHLAYTGVVRVTETDRADGTGTEYDVASARTESLKQFEAEDARRWREYIEYCITDKINNKKAVPATPDAIKRIIARRNYRLSDFGIAPVGEIQPQDTAVAALTAQLAEMKALLEKQSAKLKELGVE